MLINMWFKSSQIQEDPLMVDTVKSYQASRKLLPFLLILRLKNLELCLI